MVVEVPNPPNEGVTFRTMRIEVEAKPRGRALAATLAGAVAALLLAACHSKNPDSLIGMNVDENLAVMDANAVDANATDSGAAPAQASTDQSDETAAAAPNRGNSAVSQTSPELNAIEPEPDNPPAEDQTNQVENDQQPPGA